MEIVRITGMYKDDGSLIPERRTGNGIIKWYTTECDVYPISLNERDGRLIDLTIMTTMITAIKEI